ncbi:Holliday junction resolvase RuvX [Alkalihalophilus marmarensis]|jgi:putative Holliday junction resolvase|uniref:Putative pre-16S rRNA nuclease n=1 Tax=Alkalihalophilus marmarensis DSM 21297 TaxID=1188261 RepID=U6STS6_9BACI|nr:Holliday junction resolvase RuvX [Alkalihalophilus marmarensis]ERN55028.1 Holliday junction resolvase [Alkalihalophilus marmarensis DSM 21297]MCM3489334.1 Holliday junction resolvase RuvX [Alkalihalophilus marmarensis]
MRALGLDVGTKTVGIALSDELGWTAQGIETLRRNEEDPESDFLKIAELARQNDVGTIVIGLPKNMNGTIGPSGERCMEFADSLKEHLDCEFVMWDERLTTVAAERMLVSADVSRKKRKKVIDKMAAVMILQGYLDRKGM